MLGMTVAVAVAIEEASKLFAKQMICIKKDGFRKNSVFFISNCRFYGNISSFYREHIEYDFLRNHTYRQKLC